MTDSLRRPVPNRVGYGDPRWLHPTVQDPSRVRRYTVGGPSGGSVPQDTEDPGHLIPADMWVAVEAGAAARERQLTDPARRSAELLAAVDRSIPAYAHGGTMPGGPRLAVLHSAETPLRAGYAYSIAANWFATSRAGTSAHLMIDPAETIRMLPDNVVAYAVGPKANGFTWNVEQAGTAAAGRVQWLADPLGLAQMRRVATEMRELSDRWGMPLRRATDAQIRAAARGELQRAGWCTHDDVRRVLGGTTHTDPGDYPWDELLDLADEGGDGMAFTAEHAQMLEDLHYGLRRPVILGVTMSAAQRELLERARAGDGSVPVTAAAEAEPDTEQQVPWTEQQVDQLAEQLEAELTPEQVRYLVGRLQS